MKPPAFLPALACLLATSLAEDRIRDVQAALKTQGFYYGDVTGAESAETGAAIRRFQIRNGITVTGKLNADTLGALGLGEKKITGVPPQPAPASLPATQPAPAPAADAPAQKQLNPPPPTNQPMPKPGEPIIALKKEKALPPETEPAIATQTPARRGTQDIAVVEPPTPIPAPVSTQLTTMFRDTPYATATREMQMNVIRRAQTVMAARRLYRGMIDGVAGAATSEAIFLFQDEAELRRTGRLDTDTLAEMKLLPPPAPGNPLLKPFYNPNRRRDRSVSSE